MRFLRMTITLNVIFTFSVRNQILKGSKDNDLKKVLRSPLDFPQASQIQFLRTCSSETHARWYYSMWCEL